MSQLYALARVCDPCDHYPCAGTIAEHSLCELLRSPSTMCQHPDWLRALLALALTDVGHVCATVKLLVRVAFISQSSTE
jgi:hypothetical protein